MIKNWLFKVWVKFIIEVYKMYVRVMPDYIKVKIMKECDDNVIQPTIKELEDRLRNEYVWNDLAYEICTDVLTFHSNTYKKVNKRLRKKICRLKRSN